MTPELRRLPLDSALPVRLRWLRSVGLGGVTERLGIGFSYDYDVTYASSAYERRFFSTLSRLARPAPLTALQQQYNDQQHNVLEVTDNHHIDAPTVERWLADHPPAGLQVPRLHQDQRARPRHRLQLRRRGREPQADRLGRHHPRRRGERARQAAPGVVLRPVGRAGVLDRQLERRRRRRGRRRRAGLPHAAGLGVHPGRLPVALGPVRRPGQGGPLRRINLNQDLPLTGKARECYDLWLPAKDTPCYPDLDYPAFANLFLFNALHLERTQDDAGRVDYELPNFNYATTNAEEGGLLGYADDNYRTGTQSFVFNFVSPAIAENYGLTTTIIHEDGHHLAMSHPHDGYDSETGVDYEPTGPYYFAWSGDESNTMMSYIDLNWDFSQFDRDNMNRYMAAAFARNANRIAADILADPDAGRAADELAAADRLLGAAKAAFRGHRYLAASFLAKGAYDLVRRGARQAGVPVVGSHEGWQVDEPGSDAAAAAKVEDAATVDHLRPHSHRLRR